MDSVNFVSTSCASLLKFKIRQILHYFIYLTSIYLPLWITYFRKPRFNYRVSAIHNRRSCFYNPRLHFQPSTTFLRFFRIQLQIKICQSCIITWNLLVYYSSVCGFSIEMLPYGWPLLRGLSRQLNLLQLSAIQALHLDWWWDDENLSHKMVFPLDSSNLSKKADLGRFHASVGVFTSTRKQHLQKKILSKTHLM